jgi:glucose/arabinose dehydrogenase
MDASLRRSRRAGAALLAAACLTLASCGDFSTTAQTFTAQPSLTAPVVTPVIPPPAAGATSGSAPSPSTSGAPSSSPSSTAPADPCRPTDPVVVAACLAAPWGLAPLPDGTSALVGERTTGRILKVAPGAPPVVVATVAGIDASGTGGLLGIAVSPSYLEDGLIYAYVTTATDNRVLRIAAGDKPKAILTGIPKGNNNGGAIAFTAESILYVGTGAGSSTAAASRTSLAGKLLRIDEFGKPAKGNPTATSPVFASGFTQITGMCTLPTGAMAAVDHRPAADVLVAAKSGRNYSSLASGDAVWTYKTGDGGAADCAASDGVLATTSLAKQQLVGINMSATGSFSGTPRVLLDSKYGRLLSVEPGAKGAVWLTTSNKDGHGKPVPADDRVLLLPNAGGGGGNGPD